MAKKSKKTQVKKVKKVAKKVAPKVAKKATKKAVKKSSPAKATKTPNAALTATSTMVGQSAPSITVKNSKNEDCNLSQMKGRKIVLYFYPKDDTPGCTIEGHEFTAHVEAFAAKNATVLGVSRDSVKSHDKFICKYNYKVELLSDDQSKLCNYFDVIKEKNMYGKKVMGIERSTFVIDESGKIIQEFRKVKAEGHAAAVLAAL